MEITMTGFCLSCDSEIRRSDKTVKCGVCCDKLHAKCAKLTEQEIKMINENENINFNCKTCNRIDMRGEIRELKDLVEQCIGKLNLQSEIIAKNSDLIEELGKNKAADLQNNSPNAESSSYAQILNKKREVIVIKPINEEQGSEITRRDIKTKIDPSKLAVGIENMENIKGGGVIIKCSDSSSKGVIKRKMQEVMSDNYKVEEVVKRNPKIMIVGVEEEYVDLRDEVIIEMIAEQNGLNCKKFRVMTKYVKKTRKNIGSIIVETEPESYREIMKLGKLKMGWRICNIHDYVNIVRCYKCAGFNHLAKDCTNDKICFNCADKHEEMVNCKSTNLKCANCVRAVEKFNVRIDVKHCATDVNCPCYKKELERVNNRISYNE